MKRWQAAKEGVLYIYKDISNGAISWTRYGRPVRPDAPDALELLRKRFIIGSPETLYRTCEAGQGRARLHQSGDSARNSPAYPRTKY